MLNNLLPVCTEFHSSLSQTPAVEKGLCICCNSLPGNHLRLGTPRRFLEQKTACRYEQFNFPVCAFPCCSGSVHNKLWHSHTGLLLLVHQPVLEMYVMAARLFAEDSYEKDMPLLSSGTVIEQSCQWPGLNSICREMLEKKDAFQTYLLKKRKNSDSAVTMQNRL